ncbi:MAG: Acg family FMN-binding oxidoreductase [Frankiaceae bacterium]
MTTNAVERMVRAATLAPSLHNSQPWWFLADDGRLEVHADRSRALPVVDPDGRWLLVSCGAATLNAVVAGRAAGRECRVGIDAAAEAGDRVATIALGTWIVPSTNDVRLSRATVTRRTERAPLASGRLSPVLVDDLRSAAASEGCWTCTITARAEVAELSALLRRAEEEQQAQPGYREELRSWVRELGSPAEDGVPAEALPTGSLDREASDVWLRDFGGTGGGQGSEAGPAGQRTERPLVVVLGTSTDGPAAWVRTGLAMERLLLTAAAAGVTGSPLTQVLEVPRYRAELATLVGIEGFPQMVLRLGRPTAATPPAPPVRRRRPLTEVLRVAQR